MSDDDTKKRQKWFVMVIEIACMEFEKKWWKKHGCYENANRSGILNEPLCFLSFKYMHIYIL